MLIVNYFSFTTPKMNISIGTKYFEFTAQNIIFYQKLDNNNYTKDSS